MANHADVDGPRRARRKPGRAMWGTGCSVAAVLMCAGLGWFGCDQLSDEESEPFLPDTLAAAADQSVSPQPGSGYAQNQPMPGMPMGPGQGGPGNGQPPEPGEFAGEMPPRPPLPPRPDPMIALIDADKDGTLSAEEIAAADEAIATLDVNGDGLVDEEELRPEPPSEEPDIVTILMEHHDKDGDGLLTVDELLPGLARGLLSEADTDGDGALSEAELTAWAEAWEPPGEVMPDGE